MARRCEMLLLVMVVAIGCRRPAPPPPPAPETPVSAAPVASTPAADSPASSAPAPQGLVDEAAKIEAAKNKEASPGKSASSGGERHVPSAGGARTRAARVAEESLQPKTKERRTHEAKAGEKIGGEEGKVVAARDEVAAAPESPVQAQVRTTLRFKNEAGPSYKLVE